MGDYRSGPINANYSRPPISMNKRPLISRTTSIERDDRLDSKSERIYRSSSLQRPSNYLPAFDHI